MKTDKKGHHVRRCPISAQNLVETKKIIQLSRAMLIIRAPPRNVSRTPGGAGTSG